MNKVAIILATAAALMTGAYALAEEPAKAPDAKQEKKICKTEKLTGSLTRVRRICMTRTEWDKLAEGTNRDIDALARDANQVEAVRRSSST
jgi:hypothetical protein